MEFEGEWNMVKYASDNSMEKIGRIYGYCHKG